MTNLIIVIFTQFIFISFMKLYIILQPKKDDKNDYLFSSIIIKLLIIIK